VKRVLRREKIKRKGALLVILVDDDAIRSLNRRFLGKDRATDVLSFIYGDEDIFGETYISVDRAHVQSAEYGVPFETELSRLIIHGVLHLLGYTDKSGAEKARMREAEERYLAEAVRA
jgi:probable rRNA maturation factor